MSEVESHPLPHSALLFMAAVEEARLTDEGPFRAIAPVFRIALEHQRGQLLNVANAAQVLNPIFGETFSIHALEAFLPQLLALGWLAEQKANDGRVAYLVNAELPALDDNTASEGSLHKLERLHDRFKEFVELKVPLLPPQLNPEQFKWQLFRWATSLDGSDKDAVREEASKLVAGKRPTIRNSFLDENQRHSRVGKQLSIEFAGFVKWLAETGSPELADVVSLTELGLAIEFLDELRTPSSAIGDKIDTIFVLDAPVILDLLGLSGPARKASIERCVSALKARGSRFVTLAHCLEELADILKTVLGRPNALRFGLTGDALKADPKLVPFARQVAQQPDKASKAVGVEVLTFERNNPTNEKYFPDTLIDKFRANARWHDQYKTDQRERDAMSIAFVMRRRAGKACSDVFESPNVLVTRNSTFTEFSAQFVCDENVTPSYAFGPAIETKTLAAMVWMRFGAQVDPDLPEIHLISACDRILASNGELLRKAERRIKDLEGEDSATALLSSHQAVLDLVIATGGSPDVIDSANGEELLRALTATAEARGREIERARSQSERASIEAALGERESAIQELADKNLELATNDLMKERQLREREDVIQRHLTAETTRIEGAANAMFEKASGRARLLVLLFWVMIGLVGTIGQFFIWGGTVWWREDPTNLLLGLAVMICALLLVVMGMRWLPSGIDLPGAMHRKLTHILLRKRLANVEPVEERNRLHDYLESQGHHL